MPALAQTEANRLLDASFGTAAYAAPTTPMRVALATSTPTATAAGTEVSGGSYSRQTVTMGAATGGACSNTAAVTFTNMPAATVTAVDIYDSAGTPRRAWYGLLTASKTVAAGDTLSFAVGSVSAQLG